MKKGGWKRVQKSLETFGVIDKDTLPKNSHGTTKRGCLKDVRSDFKPAFFVRFSGPQTDVWQNSFLFLILSFRIDRSLF